MKAYEVAGYFCLLTCSIFANKYVLSVLGFQFPMVFQGWQTLVGCIVFKILSVFGIGVPKITPMDWPGFASLLPNFVLFTMYIIAGSKALASIPVIIFISAGINLIPLLSHMIDMIAKINNSQIKKSQVLRVTPSVCTIIGIMSSVILLLVSEADIESTNQQSSNNGSTNTNDNSLDLTYGTKFWLCVHVGCGLALSLHTRGFADQRFSFTDRLYYSYAFSLVVLLPASLYLEEAFEALRFRHRQQYEFVIGSLIAALVGVTLNVYQARLKEDKGRESSPQSETEKTRDIFQFGIVHHTSLALCALLSTAFYTTDLSSWEWTLSIINFLAVIPIPSHIRPDENIPLTTQLPVRMTRNNADNKNSHSDQYAYARIEEN